MTDQLYLVPASGLQVRDPATAKPLNAGGEFKPRSPYWLRRKAEGSVRVGKPGRARKAKE